MVTTKKKLIAFLDSDLNKLNKLKGSTHSQTECVRRAVRYYFDICTKETGIIKNPLNNKYYKITKIELEEDKAE